jgi:hypothetical protein
MKVRLKRHQVHTAPSTSAGHCTWNRSDAPLREGEEGTSVFTVQVTLNMVLHIFLQQITIMAEESRVTGEALRIGLKTGIFWDVTLCDSCKN